MKAALKITLSVLLVLTLALSAYLVWLANNPADEPPPSQASEELPVINVPLPSEELETPPEEAEEDYLPVGKIVITPERKAYEDAQLTIRIPAINITYLIYNGTDSASLRYGVGLYDYAQLPWEKNGNVSMAGHRNSVYNGIITDQAPFYYVDLLKDGDYIYLYDDEFVYRYVWEYCEIIEEDNWDPIRTAGYSCLTITSCHPIGVADHRIVVRAALDVVTPYSEGYDFLISAQS